MCVTEIFIDRYPDSSEVEFRRTRLCQYGRPGRPCEMHSTLENTPRRINWGEPTSEFLLNQASNTPRSSTSSNRPSIEIIREESPRPRRRRRSGLLMGALFGDPPRRRRARRENVIVVNGLPSPARSPRSPRTPPRVPSPRTWGFGGFPSLPRTPDPFVVDASPIRGRRPAIIIDNTLVNGQRQRRASSVEVNTSRHSGRFRSHSRSRSRTPSVTMSDIRREDAEREAERRRQRDRRAARLEAELEAERERRRRAERHAWHDAEINSRPAVPPAPIPYRHRAVIDQSERLHEILDDLHLTARGERVIAEAVAERRRREDRDRMIRAGLEAQEAEAQRERLRRRFTIGPSSRRRDRVLYDDGTYRYG